MPYVTIPSLPTAKVTLVAAAATPAIASALSQEGIEVIQIEPVATLPAPVAHHCDLQLLHLGGNNLLLARESQYIDSKLTEYGFLTSYLDDNLGNKYPNDISLNFLLLNNCCFGMYSITPLQLAKHCNNAGLQLVGSKQGYARCSVAVVAPQAAMTADPTLSRLLAASGIDVLQLGAGDIELAGYDTGFIGGCCGLIAKERLAFTGNLAHYRYGNEVLEFLERHNVTPVYLQDSRLLDIGGIVPLMQQS